MTKLIIIRGLPYSGKTTIGKKLSKLLDSSFIDIDEIKDNICSIPKTLHDDFIIKRAKISQNIAFELAKKILKELNRDVIISEGFRFKEFYDRVGKLANDTKSDFYSFYLNVPFHVIKERHRHNKNRKDVIHLVDECISENRIYEEDYVIDNSDNIDTALDEIMKILGVK